MRPGVRRVHPRSLVSSGFFGVRPGGGAVHWGAPLVSSGSSAIGAFTVVRHLCCRVHLGSLGSLGCGVVVVWFIWACWVHWGAPWVSSGSSWISGFIWVCPGCRRVHPGLLGSLGCARVVGGFIRTSWIH